MTSHTFTDTIEKKYYRIGEVSEMLKVPAYTIRFWVKAFDLKVKTGRGGTRYFDGANIEELVLITCLLKDHGYTINGAVRVFMLRRNRNTQEISTVLTTEA